MKGKWKGVGIATMKSLLAVGGIVATMALAGTASAHPGNGWYQTAANATQSVKQLYAGVSYAKCFAPNNRVAAIYSAHSYVDDTGARRWDHLGCGLAFTDNSYCIAIMHVTGAHWYSFYLGSFFTHGCSPYQLHRLSSAGY